MFQYNIWGAKIHSGIQYYNIKKEKNEVYQDQI